MSMLEKFAQPVELPPELLDKEIVREMKVGEIRFVHPWAMIVDMDMRCFIDELASTRRLREGTTDMKVERLDTGFRVYPPKGETWRPTNMVGTDNKKVIPVIDIIISPISARELL